MHDRKVPPRTTFDRCLVGKWVYGLMRLLGLSSALAWATLGACDGPLAAEDQPWWGERHSRNMASTATDVPRQFDFGQRDAKTGAIDSATTRNVRWVQPLGSRTYGSPIVAGGRVLIGTNNDTPRDPAITDDRGVLLCFDRQSGDFLWQLIVPKRDTLRFFDAPRAGITSTPLVLGDRVYLCTNRCEVVCLDLAGMADGNDGPFRAEGEHMTDVDDPEPRTPGPRHADILWHFDPVESLGVRSHDSANCAILDHEGLLYVTTANGLDAEHAATANPAAPSLIALDAATGRLVARNEGSPPAIAHGQWSSPAMLKHEGRAYVIFGDGAGRITAYRAVSPNEASRAVADGEPRTLEIAWRVDGNRLVSESPEAPKGGRGGDMLAVLGMPVVEGRRVYVALSSDPWISGKKWGALVCLEVSGSAGEPSVDVRWIKRGLSDTLATVAIQDDLLFFADRDGRIYCLDAQSGREHWRHDTGGDIWGSTLVADKRLFVGTRSRDFWVLAAAREKAVHGRYDLPDPMYSTPTAVDGTLLVATSGYLYALGPEQ